MQGRKRADPRLWETQASYIHWSHSIPVCLPSLLELELDRELIPIQNGSSQGGKRMKGYVSYE